MSKKRIGLIGYGSWTRNAYIPALRQDGRATLVSVAAPSQETRERIRSELGSEINVYDAIEKLLKGPQLDAVMIAVPDFMHEHTLLAALESDVAIFYEPPITDESSRPASRTRRRMSMS